MREGRKRREKKQRREQEWLFEPFVSYIVTEEIRK